jgi:transposase InsO family protein
MASATSKTPKADSHKRGVGRADHAAKLALATPVSGTTGARDAIAAVKVAIREAERLLGHSLLKDCIDPVSGEITPLTIVTDNGPAYKSTDFARFIASRPELAHVRTRHHSPETNGVVERFNGSIKYEHLFGRRQRPSAVATGTVRRSTLGHPLRPNVGFYAELRSRTRVRLLAMQGAYVPIHATGLVPSQDSSAKKG